MKFIKLEKNKYNLLYSIENPNINLEPLINFELIKLIYELNPDIYEKVVLNKISEEEAQITILMKHFFNELGFPQKFSYMGLKKCVSQNRINFVGASIFSEKPQHIENEVELLPIENLNVACPNHLGDWYFTGNFPTPGGNQVVNKAFVNFMKGVEVRAY
jgi:hypothetical protein